MPSWPCRPGILGKAERQASDDPRAVRCESTCRIGCRPPQVDGPKRVDGPKSMDPKNRWTQKIDGPEGRWPARRAASGARITLSLLSLSLSPVPQSLSCPSVSPVPQSLLSSVVLPAACSAAHSKVAQAGGHSRGHCCLSTDQRIACLPSTLTVLACGPLSPISSKNVTRVPGSTDRAPSSRMLFLWK
jgi:hypothetical protein